MPPADFSAIPLSELAQQCAQETHKFFQSQGDDAPSCLELFQRAIIAGQERAWDYIYQQYESQVTRWVLRHPQFKSTGETAEYFVNIAFTRMWRALTPEKFKNFHSIKEVLRYLQMCVHSVIVDYLRTQHTDTANVDNPTVINLQITNGVPLESSVVDGIYRNELWTIIKTKLNGDKEETVFYCCYTLGMKPREVYQQYSENFSDVREIYRIKENLLNRLRRDRELKSFI